MKRPLIGLFIGLLVSIAPIGLSTAIAGEGHDAGYEWAEENDVDDVSDCDGHARRSTYRSTLAGFKEGCEEYVEDNVPEDEGEEED